MNIQEQLNAIAAAMGKEVSAALSAMRDEFAQELAEVRNSIDTSNDAIRKFEGYISGVNDKLDKAKDLTTSLDEVRGQLNETSQKCIASFEHANNLFEELRKTQAPEIDVDLLKSKISDGLSIEFKGSLAALASDIQNKLDEVKASIPDVDSFQPVVTDGVDGKDALQIEVLPEIDEKKSYARGTYATHNGGLFRAYQKTTGMNGWECIVNGVAGIYIEEAGKGIKITASLSDGSKCSYDLGIPTPQYKGVYKPDGEYEKGDFVTFDGSLWVLDKEIPETGPGNGDAWRLAVKRGERGQGLYSIARKHGFKGTEKELLDHIIKGDKPDTIVRL